MNKASINIPDTNACKSLLDYLETLEHLLGKDSSVTTTLKQQTAELLHTVYGSLQYLKSTVNDYDIDKKILLEHIDLLEKYLYSQTPADLSPAQQNHPLHTGQTKKEPPFQNPVDTSPAHPKILPALQESKSPGLSPQNNIMNYVWRLAHAPDEWEVKRLIADWQTQQAVQYPENALPTTPAQGDLVLCGTAYHQENPQFITSIRHLALDSNALLSRISGENVWLSFEKDWVSRFHFPESYVFLNSRPHFQQLAAAWENYLNWVLLIPQGVCILNNSMSYLEDNRTAFSKALALFNTNLKRSLENPEVVREFPVRLHNLFSAMKGQLLLENNLGRRKTSPTVIDRINMVADEVRLQCLADLSIKEEIPIGFDRLGLLLPQLKSKVENNIPVKNEFADFLGLQSEKQNQVVYWYKPYWNIDTQDNAHASSLPGSVLYAT